MKILLISSYLPHPLIDGGKVRLYNLIKLLSVNHEITLVCEKWGAQSEEDISEVKKICKKVLVVERPKAFSIQNLIKSIFSLNPLLVTVHTNRTLKKLIKQELKNENYDLIHLETFYIYKNLPKTNIPVVLVEHNIEYKVYERYANKFPIFLRPFFFPDLIKLRLSERKAWEIANKTIAVSEIERKIIGKNSEIVPNGVDINKFYFKKKDNVSRQKKILFIGNFKWIQNKDAATYIIKNVWPKILTLNDSELDLKLWIVGKNIPSSIKIQNNKDIIFDENAPDETEKIFHMADLLLAPIRVGGGTSYKILESMASGTPVITSSLGNEGIEALGNQEILIADKPDEMADKLVKLLNDKYLYEKIARNGRKFIEEKYDWKEIAKSLEKIYQETKKYEKINSIYCKFQRW